MVTTSAGLEAYLANPSKRTSDSSWSPLVVRSRIEPGRQDHLVLPAAPDPWIVVVIAGQRSMEVKRRGRWHQGWSGPRHVAITAAGSPNEIRWKSESVTPIETLHVCLDSQFLRQLSHELGAGTDPEIRDILTEQDAVLAHVAALLRQRLYDGPATGHALFVEAAAQMLGVRLLENYASFPVAAVRSRPALARYQRARVQEFVEAHLTEKIHLDQLAHAAGLSPYHFARMFKRLTGITPHRYVANAKFERAKQLLLEKRWSVRRVAHALGFQSEAHFSTTFKAHTGQAPSALRRDGK